MRVYPARRADGHDRSSRWRVRACSIILARVLRGVPPNRSRGPANRAGNLTRSPYPRSSPDLPGRGEKRRRTPGARQSSPGTLCSSLGSRVRISAAHVAWSSATPSPMSGGWAWPAPRCRREPWIRAADQPLAILFDAEHPGQPDQAAVVGEDADDVRCGGRPSLFKRSSGFVDRRVRAGNTATPTGTWPTAGSRCRRCSAPAHRRERCARAGEVHAVNHEPLGIA
jgi:hypothetical protein